ncbi:MAG: TIGR04283 family arsenosugar biosynthesis glycosyltransferase [Alphaproteobacteria bacterium]
MPGRPTLGVVIPTLNAGAGLARTLEALTQDVFDLDVVVVDGGSDDDTVAVAEGLGARVMAAAKGRGTQLAAGVEAVRGDWLLFVHADTVLDAGWADELAGFMANHRDRAAYFRLVLNDDAPGARRVERMAAWRCRVLGLPYGDQGLAIARDLYTAFGGYPDQPLMEDVYLARRLGRSRLVGLETVAMTSAVRYRYGGYWRRPSRNLICLFLYLMGVPARMIARIYR